MTSDKSSPNKNPPVQQRAKLDAATLQNMAHQTIDAAAHTSADDGNCKSIIPLMEKLSPSNLLLLKNIVRVILEEQNRDID